MNAPRSDRGLGHALRLGALAALTALSLGLAGCIDDFHRRPDGAGSPPPPPPPPGATP